MKFTELALNNSILDAIDAMRFDECTPIQEQAIPPLLKGRDLMGIAQTGTGKTAAYLLPVLQKLSMGNYPKDAVNCLILSPTRELAQQIDQAIEGFSYFLPVSSVAVYGGNDGIRYDQEIKSMQLGADMIIATPGRLISHLSLGNLDLSQVSFFILDEADRMLDMGFSEDVMKIASFLPKKRQTLMFSATMPPEIKKMAKVLLNNPVHIEIAISKPAENIDQSAYFCTELQKTNILRHLFNQEQQPQHIIIFSSSKQKVKELSIIMRKMGINAKEMHSDLDQKQRDEAMREFKAHNIDVLVATDILSRGIDIDDIEMVINYDVPHDAEDYVHRVGRTARAGRSGKAITFVTEKDFIHFRRIEKIIERKIPVNTLPDGMEAPHFELKQPTKHKQPFKQRTPRKNTQAEASNHKAKDQNKKWRRPHRHSTFKQKKEQA